MQYQGGKHRQAKRLVARMLELSSHRHVVEPFCGGCSMTAEFARQGCTVSAFDAHPALVSMWRAALEGWTAPTEVSRDDYATGCSLPDGDPRKAFFEFGCSFGGKSWGGYAAGLNSTSPLTYPQCAAKGIETKAAAMRGRVTVYRASFFDLEPRYPGILYCDPPYADTLGYRPGAFDSAAFWARCQEWANAGHDVFVSEYSAPEGVESVLSLHRRQVLRLSRGAGSNADQARVEHLYRIGRLG